MSSQNNTNHQERTDASLSKRFSDITPKNMIDALASSNFQKETSRTTLIGMERGDYTQVGLSFRKPDLQSPPDTPNKRPHWPHRSQAESDEFDLIFSGTMLMEGCCASCWSTFLRSSYPFTPLIIRTSSLP